MLSTRKFVSRIKTCLRPTETQKQTRGWACLSGWLLLDTAVYVKSMNVAGFAPWCFVLILVRVA